MIAKIISFFTAVIMSLTGLGEKVTCSGIKEVFSDAFSLVSERSEFLDEIDDEDISCFTDNDGYVKNMMLVFFEEDASFFEKLGVLGKIDGAVVGSLPEAELCVVATPAYNLEQLTAECEKTQKLDAVALASICPARKYETQYTPNDPFGEYYWEIDEWNETTPEGNKWWAEAVEARAAWGYSSYFEHINIGIVDSGFDIYHKDLQDKIVFTSDDEAVKNEIDSHGTHVAGVIAATADNGIGISGLCQNSTLICLNWDRGWMPDVNIFFGFGKVVKAGAKVINFSIGCAGSLDEDEMEWSALYNLIEGAAYSYYMGSLLSKGYDFVVVQSAGNGNWGGHPIDSGENGVFCTVNEKSIFAPFAEVSADDILDRILIVSAMEPDGEGGYVQTSFSNVGYGVDVAAPGEDIYSCIEGGYTCYGGTSMAAPMVTGIASLVWSVDPALDGGEVADIVRVSSKAVAKPADYYKFADKLDLTDYPVVNAKLSVEAALKNKYDMNSISVLAQPESTVCFTDADSNEFIFETDTNGSLTCLLESGEYNVSVNGEKKEKVTVDGDEVFDFNTLTEEPEIPEEETTVTEE